MLRALIYINTDLVDKLCMWNQGVTNKRGQFRYLVWLESVRLASKKRQPAIGECLDWQKEVWHKREDGWQVLVMKSLKALK